MTTFTATATRIMAASAEEIWAVIDDTSRYADWVDGVREVTTNHGGATVGKAYHERNRTVGPLTTSSTWTVLEREPTTRRTDAGTGFAPLLDLVNEFRLAPVGNGQNTQMDYEVRYRLALGPFSQPVAKVLQASLVAEFGRSMANLEALIISERPLKATA